jgi:hypothetical protein
MKVFLQFVRNRRALDVPAISGIVTRKPPQIGAVIDIQRRARAVLACQPQGLQHRRFGARVAEMRAGDGHASRFGDEGRVNVVFAQRHVGTVLAIEDQREPVLIADAQQNQRRQAFRVGPDASHIDALGG